MYSYKGPPGSSAVHGPVQGLVLWPGRELHVLEHLHTEYMLTACGQREMIHRARLQAVGVKGQRGFFTKTYFFRCLIFELFGRPEMGPGGPRRGLKSFLEAVRFILAECLYLCWYLCANIFFSMFIEDPFCTKCNK